MRDCRAPGFRGDLMEEASLPFEEGNPSHERDRKATEDRFPPLSEECVSQLDRTAEVETLQKAGSQVQLIRALAPFLESDDNSSQRPK